MSTELHWILNYKYICYYHHRVLIMEKYSLTFFHIINLENVKKVPFQLVSAIPHYMTMRKYRMKALLPFFMMLTQLTTKHAQFFASCAFQGH